MIPLAALFIAMAGPTPAADPIRHVAISRDQVRVHIYEFPSGGEPAGAPLLMFHQAEADARGEFGPIAERLAALGRPVFAADLRLGGGRFGSENLTSSGYAGEAGGYCDAYPDLEAALDHVHRRTNRRVILVGSSYSGALVVRLTSMHPDKVAGFVAFSPAGGAAMRGCEAEAHLATLEVPGLAIRNRSSAGRVDWVGESNRLWREAGMSVVEVEAEGHGASLLVPERARGPVAPVWNAFTRFLASVERASGTAGAEARSVDSSRPAAAGRALVEQASRFRSLVEQGDHVAARALMAPDARRWWDSRDGPGRPWVVDHGSPGPWAGWDRHFRSERVLAGWRVSGLSATAFILERNDFYRLLERAPPLNEVTYYFDAAGRIDGLLISSRGPRDPGRTEQFLEWARVHEPAELAVLMPNSEIDPSGDNPPRFRRLLNRWREATGRAPVE